MRERKRTIGSAEQSRTEKLASSTVLRRRRQPILVPQPKQEPVFGRVFVLVCEIGLCERFGR